MAEEDKPAKVFSQADSNTMLDRTGVNPAMWSMMTELSRQCIASEAFPTTFKNPAQALVVMQAGVELGIKPMQAIQSMFFINGKLSMYSSALLSMMKRNGLVVNWKVLTPERVTGIFSSKDQPEVEISFGTEDAKRANLNNANYTKYPQDMFVARCVSRAAKLFPDLIGAPIETREVMEDVVAADILEGKNTPPPAQLQTPQEKKEARKQEKQAAAAVPVEVREAEFLGDPDVAEIIEEMQCAESEEDFEGVRQMIVGRSWSVDKARFLGDKFVFYKEGKHKQQPDPSVKVAEEIFSAPAAPAVLAKKTREQRSEELNAMKSVDLKPILSGYEIDFTGMDKATRISAILGYEFPGAAAPDSEPQPQGYVNQDGGTPPPDSPEPAQEEKPTGVLGKLFGAR